MKTLARKIQVLGIGWGIMEKEPIVPRLIAPQVSLRLTKEE
jgi:hypothetical protein